MRAAPAAALTASVRAAAAGEPDRTALLAAAADRVRRLAAAPPAARLTDLAIRHGVVGCVWAAVRAAGHADAPVFARLRQAYHADLARHLRTLADLRAVGRALAAAGAPVTVLKGPVLAEVIYPRPDLRGYADLDVLVAPARLGVALRALEAAGMPALDRNWTLLRAHMVGEVRVQAPGGTCVDLHWHLLGDRAAREEFPVDLAGLLERTVPVDVGGFEVATLDPVDTVLHVALHACLEGAHRLVWLLDVALAARRLSDWDELVERARSWRAGTPLALVLRRATRVTDLAVPEAVFDALWSERTWRRITAVADRFAPPARGAGARSPGRLVARATRADGRTSRRELGRRVLSWARQGAPRQDPPVASLFDPRDPGSTAYEDERAGAAREEYIAAVQGYPAVDPAEPRSGTTADR